MYEPFGTVWVRLPAVVMPSQENAKKPLIVLLRPTYS
jgi:hypothetical protein